MATGSKCVMTINVSRHVQNAVWDKGLSDVRSAMREQVEKVHKYLLAFNDILMERPRSGLLPVYDAGFVSPEKQYLTVGIYGFLEGAGGAGHRHRCGRPGIRRLRGGPSCSPSTRPTAWRAGNGILWNTEMVPAENLGIKNAAWDRADRLFVPPRLL